MTAFDIRLLPSTQLGDEGERLGQITIGDFHERFACYPVNDSIESMPAQWKLELLKLLGGTAAIALVHDPRFAWVLYRVEEECFIQQHFFADGAFSKLTVRQTITDEGQRISEWQVPLSSIRAFAERLDS